MKTKQYYKITCQNKHQRNEDKTILQDDMTKQIPTQLRQNNITRSDVKTNTHTIKTKQYYKITTIIQDHMSKQTLKQSRQNNFTR